MVAYVTDPPYKSRALPITRPRWIMMESGIPRGNDLTAATGYRLTIEHPFISSAQITTLQNFYNTNRDADLTITANDGRVYDCWFENDYEFVTLSAVWFTARVNLIGNLQ